MIFGVALNMVDGLKPVQRAALLREFGSPQAVFRCAEMELCSAANIRPEVASRIVQFDIRDAEKEQQRASSMGIRVVTLEDPDYPAALRTIPDPPLALYIRGTWNDSEPAIAVVGSRKATPYGLNVAQFLSKDLAAAGMVIVSGLARGIDASAHNAALQAGGRTVAVLGSGL